MQTICGQWGEDCSPQRYEKSTLNRFLIKFLNTLNLNLFKNHLSYSFDYRLLDFMGLGMANQGFSTSSTFLTERLSPMLSNFLLLQLYPLATKL
jgi:hypothetical protein